MCEALFNLNKSFLNLGNDVCSAVALSAMMTDHYNLLEERDRDSASRDTGASAGGSAGAGGGVGGGGGEVGLSQTMVGTDG
jgi:hypothetical protein